MNNKIVIFSGGTGGHVIPAVNFGNYLISTGIECELILDLRGKKYTKNFKGKLHIIKSSHFSGNIISKIITLFNLFFGLIKSFFLITQIKPKNCISFGGYATFTPLLSILILKFFFKTKIYIHEQNSIIGKVNLIFLPFVDKIFTNFEQLKNLEKKYLIKKEFVGLPLSYKSKIKNTKNKKIIDKKIVFLYGGSQGSKALINNFVLILKNIDSRFLSKIKIIIQSPPYMFENLKNIFEGLKIDYEINDFYYNIVEILSVSDIVLTRAGAGSINDIINYNIPSMIMPIPNSIYDHQFYNAKYLTDRNAAILIKENDFDVNLNTKILKQMIEEKEFNEKIVSKLKKINIPNANKIMKLKIFL